jgi:hypothetical protein
MWCSPFASVKSSDAKMRDETISLTGAMALLLDLDPGYVVKARLATGRLRQLTEYVEGYRVIVRQRGQKQ